MLTLPSLDDTLAVGAALGRIAPAGTVVALHGDLGAGKTSFGQGVGVGLGVAVPIVSPTFILMAEYEGGRLPLLHADAYRIRPDEVAGIGLDEALETWPGVALVEWASRIEDHMPDDHMRVVLKHLDAGRTMEITAAGPVHSKVLAEWVAACAR